MLDNELSDGYNLYMSQFEYSVGLSPVKPEDVERVAREFKEAKQREADAKEDDKVRVRDTGS